MNVGVHGRWRGLWMPCIYVSSNGGGVAFESAQWKTFHRTKSFRAFVSFHLTFDFPILTQSEVEVMVNITEGSTISWKEDVGGDLN